MPYFTNGRELVQSREVQRVSMPGRAIALPLHTRGRSRMRESCTYGSVRGARGNSRPYRDSI
jgi:hypothetical protein